MKLLKQATYVRYVLKKLSKFIQTAHRPPQIPIFRGFFENQKEPGTSFQTTVFIEFFDKNFPFLMLHKLAKFHN